jgi:hypothetical protein
MNYSSVNILDPPPTVNEKKTPPKQPTMTMNKMKNAYIPLKETDKNEQNVKMSVVDYATIKQLKTANENFKVMGGKQKQPSNFRIELKDTMATNIFVGGISLIGIYILHNLLYK